MNRDDNRKTRDIPKHPDIEISVRNFGPIAAVDLDLRPLTVFVGPTNTGKTYLSILSYALHRTFMGFSESPLIDHVAESLSPNVLRSGSSMYPEPFGTELKRCFNLDSVSELRQWNCGERNEMVIALKVSAENQNLWHFDMRCSKSGVIVRGGINKDMVLPPEDGERWAETLHPKNDSDPLPQQSRITRKHHYLPATRGNIMQSYRVERSFAKRFSEAPTLSDVTTDFMQQIILYEENTKPDNELNQIADALEREVLAGRIITKASPTGCPEFRYHPKEIEEDIRLPRASSMVSELAPLVLLIRGIIRPGDTLIIEEPESHLPPASQVKMAVTLARLVRAGVQVLVTTHSDWLLQEIGHLMREGELGDHTGEPASWLEFREVGAWLFQKNGKVEEIKFNRIKGIEPIEYQDVAVDLYNDWAILQNRLERTKGDNKREHE